MKPPVFWGFSTELTVFVEKFTLDYYPKFKLYKELSGTIFGEFAEREKKIPFLDVALIALNAKYRLNTP